MRRVLPFLLFAFALIISFAIYAPGLHGAFMFDDTINILSNETLRLNNFTFETLKTATMSGTAGMLGRPVSMMSFALNHMQAGMSPYAFKLTNVLIHLATGCAVFALVELILKAHRNITPATLPQHRTIWISLAVAAAFLFHPLNLTSVLYVVQRMTSLAALFSFCGLISFIWGRLRLQNRADMRGCLAIVASFVVFTPLAALSKESGALLPLFLLLTELSFFRFQASSPRASRVLKLAFLLTVALPALAVLAYTAYSPGWITTSYQMRSFTMGERLLTETRVLWLYMRLALLPDISLLGLYHDDLIVSKSLLDPLTTFASALGLLMMVVVAAAAWRTQRMLAFGIAFFLLGHAMESSFLALELMHEHRNYFPLLGLLLILFYYLFAASRYVDNKITIGAVTALLLTMFAGITFARSQQWGDAVEMLVKEVEHHPDSTRANLSLANFYNATPANTVEEADRLYAAAFEHYVQASEASPHDPIGLFGLLGLNLRANRDPDPSWQPALEGRIRNNPMMASTVVALMRLEDCFETKVCKFKPEVIEGLLKAGLDNRSSQPFQRTQILFAWSSFLENEKKDFPGAAKAAYDATALSPENLSTQEALAATLVNLRYVEQARKQLAILKRMDRLQLHKNRIDELTAILDRHQQNAPTTP